MSKEIIGFSGSTFRTLGASSHARHDRELNDFYATDPNAINFLFEHESFAKDIWECACGSGHLSKRMANFGKSVLSTDLVDRGFGVSGVDFLKQTKCISYAYEGFDIITNPPYRLATKFVYKALEILSERRKCAFFLKLTFCESQTRKKLFKENPPKRIYVFSKRMKCAINGDFENTGSSAACYAWFVWEKGYLGETVLKWI